MHIISYLFLLVSMRLRRPHLLQAAPSDPGLLPCSADMLKAREWFETFLANSADQTLVTTSSNFQYCGSRLHHEVHKYRKEAIIPMFAPLPQKSLCSQAFGFVGGTAAWMS